MPRDQSQPDPLLVFADATKAAKPSWHLIENGVPIAAGLIKIALVVLAVKWLFFT